MKKDPDARRTRPARLRGWPLGRNGGAHVPEDEPGQSTATTRPLSGADVVLWRISADDVVCDLSGLSAQLDPATRTRAEALRTPRDRRRFILFQSALRSILAARVGCEPADLVFAAGRFGKPALSPEVPGLAFNLSHAGGLAVLAVSDGAPIGVDIELCRPFPAADRMAARYLSEPEQADYRRLPAAERAAAFLRAWTRKEAYLKATGEGLSFPPEKVQVTFAPGEAARLVHVDDRPEAATRWSLGDFRLTVGAVMAIGALAIAGPPPDRTLRQHIFATGTV